MHFSTVGLLASASSTVSLSGSALPRRQPMSAVICSLAAGVAVALGDRLGREAGEDHRMDRADPAQASIAIANSGTIGM